MTPRLLMVAQSPFPPDFILPQGVVDIVQSFFLTVGLIALGVPIIRAISRRWETGSSVPTLPSDLTHRLERIEQAVEAVAIEVERMAEAQRFTAKLMVEQRSLPPGEPAASDSKPRAREAELRPPERGR
jgi:hypothetical protein